jgi:hypothetical protein
MGSEARNHIARGLPVAQRCRQPAVSTENCALDHTTQCEIAPRYGNGRGKEDSRMKIGILKKPLAATALLLALSTTADAQDVIVCESLAGLNDTMTYMAFTNESLRARYATPALKSATLITSFTGWRPLARPRLVTRYLAKQCDVRWRDLRRLLKPGALAAKL